MFHGFTRLYKKNSALAIRVGREDKRTRTDEIVDSKEEEEFYGGVCRYRVGRGE